MERGISMTQTLICRLTHCPGHKTATVVLEDMDRRLELAVLILAGEVCCLARVLGLTRCPCVPVLELRQASRPFQYPHAACGVG